VYLRKEKINCGVRFLFPTTAHYYTQYRDITKDVNSRVLQPGVSTLQNLELVERQTFGDIFYVITYCILTYVF
jgi:hypothetical protein